MTCRLLSSFGRDGEQQVDAGTAPLSTWRGVQGELVHSQTLPAMSYSPYPFGGYVPTAVVRPFVLGRSLRHGKWPCHVLAMTRPSGMNSSPHVYRAPTSPPRAAYSHSASLGRRLPLHAA